MGVVSSLAYSVFLWNWVKSCRRPEFAHPYSNATVLGYIFLFIGGLMACGIVGPPGYALSDNPALVNRDWIMRASIMSLSLSMGGWLFTLIGQVRALRRQGHAAAAQTAAAAPVPAPEAVLVG
ncbi:hypothetical protein D0T11_12225 [Hymenobacter rubripertinctus]|uniref:Uncharacterized protein n=2 Tax=Hymenobacter rubripertinctus TaxID=2029981 RepID=A0A418QWT4_9BACT|nr:hypothetical protein D0T11_12225 [Hymenobacter rubripertinctus]